MTLADDIRRAGGLANAADLARAWGLSRARVSALIRRDGFPAPVGTVGGNPVWALSECQQWRQAHHPVHQ